MEGVFGVPLEVLVDRNGSDSVMGSGPGSLRIPSFVDDAISAMRQMGVNSHLKSLTVDMSVEGVFRKNGNIRRLKELSEALDKQTNPPPLEEENPVQLAALLKKWLRELPDPLLTCKLQKLWVSSTRTPPAQRALSTVADIFRINGSGYADTGVAFNVLFTPQT